MTPIFWIAVVLDTLLFVILVVLGLTEKGPADGGREMALFFSVIVPAILVGGGVLLFVKSESAGWRALGLLIVAGPGLLLGATRVRSAAIDHQVRRNADGSGYFSGREMQRAGSAVVRRDVAALERFDRRIDVNTKGTRGMTLMELAVTQAWESSAAASGSTTSLDVVRALLTLGADPNFGLEIATKAPDIAILAGLLNAGAKPNYSDDRGPVVFRWLNVMPFAHFMALLDHGLDVNLIDQFGAPLIIAAAQADRWDFVVVLISRGADPLRKDRGTTLADVVQSRVASTTDRPPEMKADIARVQAQLAARRAQPTTR